MIGVRLRNGTVVHLKVRGYDSSYIAELVTKHFGMEAWAV